MKTQSIRFPIELQTQINEDRQRKKVERGREPTFTDWILEAAAEKLTRDNLDKTK